MFNCKTRKGGIYRTGPIHVYIQSMYNVRTMAASWLHHCHDQLNHQLLDRRFIYL